MPVSLRYIALRLLQIIPTFLLIMVVMFVLVRLLPGDPTSALLGERATDEAVERINRQLGLDRPIIVQFAFFLDRMILHGDLGESIVLKTSVIDLIFARLPVTLLLTALAGLLALLMAVPLAFVAALRHGKLADSSIRACFQIGLSTPVFYLGILLLTLFAAHLRWFPVGGYGQTLGDKLYHLFLPALTLALSLSAVIMRNLRNSIVEVLEAEYVDFARAKGLKPRVVLGKHVLRNAIIPTVTLFGLNIGTLLGGAVITESVFAVPGAGRLMIDSIYGRDYPVILGLTLALVLLVSLAFLLTDLIQAAIDPRVSA